MLSPFFIRALFTRVDLTQESFQVENSQIFLFFTWNIINFSQPKSLNRFEWILNMQVIIGITSKWLRITSMRLDHPTRTARGRGCSLPNRPCMPIRSLDLSEIIMRSNHESLPHFQFPHIIICSPDNDRFCSLSFLWINTCRSVGPNDWSILSVTIWCNQSIFPWYIIVYNHDDGIWNLGSRWTEWNEMIPMTLFGNQMSLWLMARSYGKNQSHGKSFKQTVWMY